MEEGLTPIPPNVPPWLRKLFEVRQFLDMTFDAKTADPEGMNPTDVDSELNDPEEVFWIWYDWQRDHFEFALSNSEIRRTGGLEDLDEGRHIEYDGGGLSGYPTVVFPSGDPLMFLEAKPFQAREIVTLVVDSVMANNYIDRVAPLDQFKLAVEPD